MPLDKAAVIAQELHLAIPGVTTAINLLKEGNTVPFIARYRKEQTGGLTDENLRHLEERLVYLEGLEDRKKTVFKSLKEQNIENPDLHEKIENSLLLSEVEDLYRPYKPKKITRAVKARKAGLTPLRDFFLADRTGRLKEEAAKYITEEYGSAEACIQGAMDIVAEEISDNPNYRTFIKNIAYKRGIVKTTKTKDADSDVYDNYADYSRPILSLKGYNVLAINRGVKRKCLNRKLLLPDEEILSHILSLSFSRNSPYSEWNRRTAEDSYERLIRPSIENEVFSDLMDKASTEAIEEFKVSLRATLLYPPLRGQKVMGFDPGFAHGCKLAFIDENGSVLGTYVLNNPFMNERSAQAAKAKLRELILRYGTYVVALGNGHASRESESLLRQLKKEEGMDGLQIVIVSESGASIYSATELAQKEFPQYEPNIRSAISIARRLEDPLAELVKIPPMSIGVGQYQYDIDEKRLSEALKGVVEDAVNYVGVNLNSASAALLSYVSGINGKIASSIVSYREKHGPILSRSALKDVPYLGPKSFENCAGFLRIPESEEFLDNTAVHPESYPIARKIMQRFAIHSADSDRSALMRLSEDEKSALAVEFSVGKETLCDILAEIVKPSRDPRKEMKTAALRDDVKDIKDLKVGEILEGTIRNVTGFGFFVDLGIEINGLVHVTEIRNGRVEDPHSYGKPGDIVKVKVKAVDLDKKRISLSMKGIKQD